MLMLLAPILPEIVLFLAGCTILLLDVFNVSRRFNIFLSLCFLCLALISLFFTPHGVVYHNLVWISSYSQAIKFVSIILLLLQVVAVSPVFEKYISKTSEFVAIALFVLLGSFVMVSSYSLITLYVGLEIQAIALYVMILMQKKSRFASEAALTYFILGSLASVIYLFGVSFVYGGVGGINFNVLFNAPNQSMYIGAALVLGAFFFKVGAVPFHQWAPDVYQGAPTPVTSILFTVVKLSAVCVLLLLVYVPFKQFWTPKVLNHLITVVGCASMVLGASVAIVQKHIKRLLAYSGIYHFGFVCLGVFNLKAEGMSLVVHYMFFYSVTLLMVFVCIMSLKNKLNRANVLDDLHIHELRGLAEVKPKHAFVLALSLLSLAGVPPLFGFVPKLMLLKYALSQHALILVVVAILTTVVSLYYVLQIIKAMYMEPPFSVAFVPSQKLNYRLSLALLPVLLIQAFGAYVPWTEIAYKKYILSAVSEVVGYGHEKSNNITH